MDKVRQTIQNSIVHNRLTLKRAQEEVEQIQGRIDQLTAMLDCDHEWEELENAPFPTLKCSRCGWEVLADILEEA